MIVEEREYRLVPGSARRYLDAWQRLGREPQTRHLGERRPADSFRARWAALAMASFADRAATKGVSETYQYLVGDSAFHFTVDDGSIQLHDGRAEDPAVTLTTDEDTWADIASGKITGASAAATGALRVTGDRQAAKRLGAIFSRNRVLGSAEASVHAAAQR